MPCGIADAKSAAAPLPAPLLRPLPITAAASSASSDSATTAAAIVAAASTAVAAAAAAAMAADVATAAATLLLLAVGNAAIAAAVAVTTAALAATATQRIKTEPGSPVLRGAGKRDEELDGCGDDKGTTCVLRRRSTIWSMPRSAENTADRIMPKAPTRTHARTGADSKANTVHLLIPVPLR